MACLSWRDSNVGFDGPAANEDFGREQFTGNRADRYAFRTAPLRNIARAPAFMYGAFGSLEAAIRHHLDVIASLLAYDPTAGPAPDLTGPIAPTGPALPARPAAQHPIGATLARTTSRARGSTC